MGHLLTGGIGFAVGTALCLGIAADATYRHSLSFMFQLFFALACFWFLPATLGGWGILVGKRWGRWIIWSLSALMLPIIPVGTGLGGVGVLVLRSARAETSDNFGQAMTSVKASGRQYVELALAALAALAILAGMIGIGYLFRDQLETFHPNRVLIEPIVIGATVIIVLGYGALGGWSGAIRRLSPEAIRLRHEGQKRAGANVAAHEQRLAQLSSDPVRAKYVSLMRRGEFWSDEQIAYDLDPDRAATCQHLAPSEVSMRRAGLKVGWLMAGHVSAECQVNEAALWSEFKPAPEVRYAADLFPGGGRGSEEFPNSALQCAACDSAIHALHERESKPTTPWFPQTRLTILLRSPVTGR